MKPFSKSVWIFPAACGALVPFCHREGRERTCKANELFWRRWITGERMTHCLIGGTATCASLGGVLGQECSCLGPDFWIALHSAVPCQGSLESDKDPALLSMLSDSHSLVVLISVQAILPHCGFAALLCDHNSRASVAVNSQCCIDLVAPHLNFEMPKVWRC